MGLFDDFKNYFHGPPPPPPPSPPQVLERAWRTLNWSEDGQNLLKMITNFKPESSDVDTLRILLHGPVGGGKSSFFNSVNSVLQRRITTRALANNSNVERSFTLESKTYKVSKDRPGSYFPFTFSDIAGIHDQGIGIQSDDIVQFLNGHISDGYVFNPMRSIIEQDPNYRNNPVLNDKIHCLVAVLPANTISLIDDNKMRQMREVREKAKDLGIPQVIIMTKVDEACPLVKNNLQNVYTSKKIKEKVCVP